MKRLILVSLAISSAMFLIRCSGSDKPDPEEEQAAKKEISPESISSGGNVVKLQNQLFSIPSPIQTSILIRKQNIEFNPDLVAGTEKVDTYVNRYKKALNLGVLGSDLAYLSNYNEAKMSLDYLEQIENLAEQLDIKSNIDPMIIKRFNANIDNSDSLNVINAEFYKNAERYLKDNLQNEVAALILAGGWIESLYFASQNSDNEFLKKRVGEQKHTIPNIKAIFDSFKDELGESLSKEIAELGKEFEALNMTYEYSEPITDKSSKTTYLKSKSGVTVPAQQLEKIKAKVSKIRTIIIS